MLLNAINRAQGHLRYQLEFENLVQTIASMLMGPGTATDVFSTHDVLRMLGEFFEADNAYLCYREAGQISLVKRYAWSRNGYRPFGAVNEEFPLDCTWPYLARELKQERLVCIPQVDMLPREALREKAFSAAWRIQAIILVPMTQRSVFRGFMGFEFTRPYHEYLQHAGPLLQILSCFIMSALNRHPVQALRAREAQSAVS